MGLLSVHVLNKHQKNGEKKVSTLHPSNKQNESQIFCWWVSNVCVCAAVQSSLWALSWENSLYECFPLPPHQTFGKWCSAQMLPAYMVEQGSRPLAAVCLFVSDAIWFSPLLSRSSAALGKSHFKMIPDALRWQQKEESTRAKCLNTLLSSCRVLTGRWLETHL